MPEKIPTNPDEFPPDTAPVPEVEDAKMEKPKKKEFPDIIRRVQFNFAGTSDGIKYWNAIYGEGFIALERSSTADEPDPDKFYDVEVVSDSRTESKTESKDVRFLLKVKIIGESTVLSEAKEKKEKTIETSAEFEAFEEKVLEYMERLLREGANKDSIARGLAGLNSEKAWELRERLLAEGVGNGHIARGLAGLDSEKAWELRERLLLEGADKDYIALGLAGNHITFVWQLQVKREGLEKGLSTEGKEAKKIKKSGEESGKLRETKETEKGIIKNVAFEQRVTTKGVSPVFEYRSSDRGRKIIFLEKGSLMTPEAGNHYDVKIIQDTDPSDRMKGKYIVRLIGESVSDSENIADLLDEEDLPLKSKEKEARSEHPYAIEVDEEEKKLYILETELPINPKGGELVPKKENFKYFTLDRETLETAEKIAIAVERGEPLLLEGETSTSKTSTIEYMAMRTNNEKIRLNLNGQSDTSELIGKFIPNDGQLQIKYEEIIRNPELLKNESREILSSANAQGRALTLIESQKIAQAEGLKIPDWRWSDGLDVRAKKEGKWLILDEINLAETQILERLNSQLEKNPSITLSENGGIIVRKFTDEDRELKKQGKLQGVEELNPNFRIFATMNPAEYSGRVPMSPAYKDRWTSYKFVKPPNEKSYEQMMNFMVFGEQPEVEIRGKKYSGEKEASKLATLEDIPNFRTFIPKMAKFQAKIEDLARKREIGKSKKEKYIFTRRGLTEFMEYINSKSIVDRKTRKKITIEDAPKDIILRAIQYYYLDKISDAYDLIKVNDLLDSIGISERKWTHSFEGPKKTKGIDSEEDSLV